MDQSLFAPTLRPSTNNHWRSISLPAKTPHNNHIKFLTSKFAPCHTKTVTHHQLASVAISMQRKTGCNPTIHGVNRSRIPLADPRAKNDYLQETWPINIRKDHFKVLLMTTLLLYKTKGHGLFLILLENCFYLDGPEGSVCYVRMMS